jgi:hypothetical protein
MSIRGVPARGLGFLDRTNLVDAGTSTELHRIFPGRRRASSPSTTVLSILAETGVISMGSTRKKEGAAALTVYPSVVSAKMVQ